MLWIFVVAMAGAMLQNEMIAYTFEVLLIKLAIVKTLRFVMSCLL